MSEPVANKLPVSIKTADPKPQPSTPSNNGYAASSSSLVETHRRHQLEQLRKKFGEYGEPLRVGEYNRHVHNSRKFSDPNSLLLKSCLFA
jgi:hypothetical protein